MSKGINKVILIGNLGNDPEMKATNSLESVTTLSVATTERWKDKTSGAIEERTEWHRCVLFGRVAEVACQHLRKGSKVYIEGQLRTRKWQDKSGTERYTTEVIVRDMQMLDAKTAHDDGAPARPAQAAARPGDNAYAQASGARAQQPPQTRQAIPPAAQRAIDEWEADEVPF